MSTSRLWSQILPALGGLLLSIYQIRQMLRIISSHSGRVWHGYDVRVVHASSELSGSRLLSELPLRPGAQQATGCLGQRHRLPGVYL